MLKKQNSRIFEIAKTAEQSIKTAPLSLMLFLCFPRDF